MIRRHIAVRWLSVFALAIGVTTPHAGCATDDAAPPDVKLGIASDRLSGCDLDQTFQWLHQPGSCPETGAPFCAGFCASAGCALKYDFLTCEDLPPYAPDFTPEFSFTEYCGCNDGAGGAGGGGAGGAGGTGSAGGATTTTTSTSTSSTSTSSTSTSSTSTGAGGAGGAGSSSATTTTTGNGSSTAAGTGGGCTDNGLQYHGGPVLLGTVKLYYVFYGAWSAPAKAILTDLANHLGGTPYWNINTTYYDGANHHVSNSLAFGGSTDDHYSHGNALTDPFVREIVAKAISTHALPSDTNGIYFVLSSADVSDSFDNFSFCQNYCGYHFHAHTPGGEMKYAWVGDMDRCPAQCESQQQQGNTLNGDTGVDAMASVIAHEADEATTDPEISAWYDTLGNENADKCAYTFGSTYSPAPGATANMHLGNRDFLIQRNWVNDSCGYCAKSYP